MVGQKTNSLTGLVFFNLFATLFSFTLSLKKLSCMRKSILFSLALFLIAGTGFSQAYEGSIEYSKKKEPAFIIEFNYPVEAVQNAILLKMERLGYKGKEEKGLFNKDKGFRIYKNAFITDISSNSMDYLISVDRKSRKEKDEAIVYLIIMKDGINAMGGFDAYDVGRAKSFLNNLEPEVAAANLELQIQEQEDVVAKAEKKFKNLQSDKEDMENKIKKLQQDIQTNIKDQENTQKEIENQKEVLESLKFKRKATI